jgi:hypothetical protein
MANQTLISVPANLEQPLVLKRFITSLIERLDIILGYRGSNSYASNTELAEQGATLVEALNIVAAKAEENEAAILELSKEITELSDNIDDQLTALNQVVWLKAFYLSFIGRSSNGAVTMSNDYNISAGTRTAAGVYEFTLTQNTILGDNILDSVSTTLEHRFTRGGLTELFQVELEVVSTSVFRVLIWELSAGTATAYDPITVGDQAVIGGLFSLSGSLPPA